MSLEVTIQNNEEMDTSDQIGQLQMYWLSRANFLYGAVGLFLMVQFSTNGSWKSFLTGWLVAVMNLELLKRLGTLMIALTRGKPPGPLFYGLLLAKFSFWGMIIAMFSLTAWLQVGPFVLGTLTLIVAGIALGASSFFRELKENARRTRRI